MNAMARLYCAIAACVLLLGTADKASASQAYEYSGIGWRCKDFDPCDPQDRLSDFYPMKLEYSLMNPDAKYLFSYELHVGSFQFLTNLEYFRLSYFEPSPTPGGWIELNTIDIRDAIIEKCIIGPDWDNVCGQEGYLLLHLSIDGAIGTIKGGDQYVTEVDNYFNFSWGPTGGGGTYTQEWGNFCDQSSIFGNGGCTFVFFATVSEPGAGESIVTAIAFLIAYQARRRYRSWRWRALPGAGAPTLGPCH